MPPSTSHYLLHVTQRGQTHTWSCALPYSEIIAEVWRHYDSGADAVEMEMITEGQFWARIKKSHAREEKKRRRTPPG